MRIHADNVNLKSASGPNTFASRLFKQFYELGHEVTFDASSADVSIVFIERSGALLAKHVVQRLDGIWFKPNEFNTKNVNIKSLYESCDSVIWQSEFDRKMTTKWWGDRIGHVIHNGIDATQIKEITLPELARIRTAYEKVFVCSSNWHPQKRLMANMQMFDHLRKTKYPNSCLFVMGANPDVRTTDPHVFYTGSQPPEVYLQIFACANWMIHLAWADHCPNVVIESLSQGTPVICTEVGGTREIVDQFGVILKESSYNFELADYDNPPKIDVTQIVDLPKKHELGSHADIDIKNTAKRYIEVFESALGK